ncbi:MAG: hypothetical protein EZS28_001772 [Streblomastix strix]|uniref:Ferric oxidoreductase domain-containing protein n=1 Tax=Streblomastix strix TaxID=222440 RepID=A0A5J4X661_9EUKA|nr:MAG: hypothetical protein EZS28_001772 [Streblomastix strix]
MPEKKSIDVLVIIFRICSGVLIIIPLILSFFIFASKNYDIDRMFQIWFAYLSYIIMGLQIVSGTHFFVFQRAFGARILMKLHMWATPVMLLTALLHMILMAFASSCAGNYGRCIVNVIIDGNPYQILARIGVLILIVSTIVSLLRLCCVKKMPLIVWRIFHYLFYVAFYFVTFHIFSNGIKVITVAKGHEGAADKMDNNIFKAVHLVLPIYLLILTTVAVIIRIITQIIRILNQKKKKQELQNRNQYQSNENQLIEPA